MTGPDPVLQRLPAPAGPKIPAPMQSFDGLTNASNATFWGSLFTPPDMNGDIGTTQYFQFLNDLVQVHSKATGAIVYGPCPDTDIWTGFADTLCRRYPYGDPVTVFDRLAQRWVLLEFAFDFNIVPPYHICVAISQTDNALGKYNRYSYEFRDPSPVGVDFFPDYPKLGAWPNGYFMSINTFDASANAFTGGGAVAFDRTKMLAGNLTAQGLWFNNVEPNGGLLPSNVSSATNPPGANDPNPFVQFVEGPQQLKVWKFAPDFATPANSTFTNTANLTPAAFDSSLCGSSNCIPQPGTSVRLDDISDRLMYRLQYRRFTGSGAHDSWVVNHTVDINGADQAGIRWYELRDLNGASPSIFQQGTFGGTPVDTKHRWMGSTAMDKAGNIALGYSLSDGTSQFPSVAYTGRLAGDTLGTLPQGEGIFQVGGGSQTSSGGRWGDYSTLDVDPVDDCTFWYTTEYYATTSVSNWATRIGSFRFTGNCTTTSVKLTAFSARRSAKHTVTAAWRTASEVGLLGFNVYRADANGRLTRLNRLLIAAKRSGQTRGATYAIVDSAVPRGRAVSYRLQTVSIDGTRGWVAARSVPVR
jgi:hypothetical protein